MQTKTSYADDYIRHSSYLQIHPELAVNDYASEVSKEFLLFVKKEDLKVGINNVKTLWMPRKFEPVSCSNLHHRFEEGKSFHLSKCLKSVELSTASKLCFRLENSIMNFQPQKRFLTQAELKLLVERDYMSIKTTLRRNLWIETSGIEFNNEEIKTWEEKGDVYKIVSIDQVKADMEVCGLKIDKDFIRRPKNEDQKMTLADLSALCMSLNGNTVRACLSGLMNHLSNLYRADVAPKTISGKHVLIITGSATLNDFERVFAYEENQLQNLRDLKFVFQSSLHSLIFNRKVEKDEFLHLLEIMIPTNLSPINHLKQLKLHPTLLSNARLISLSKNFVLNLEDNGERSKEEKLFLKKLKAGFLEHCSDYSKWKTEGVLGKELFQLLQNMTDIAKKKKPGSSLKAPRRQENAMSLIRELRHRVSNSDKFSSHSNIAQ